MVLLDQEHMQDFSSIQSGCDSSTNPRVHHGMTKKCYWIRLLWRISVWHRRALLKISPLPNTKCSYCNTKSPLTFTARIMDTQRSKVITVITISHLKVAIVSVIIEVVGNAMCFYCSLWHNCQWAVCNVYNHATL